MDCHLCGAHNSIDADFCERCNGQLLKIGLDRAAEAEPEVAPEPGPPPMPELPSDDAPAASSSAPESLQSVEHRRLSAALGLGKPAAQTTPSVRPSERHSDDDGDDDGPKLTAAAVPTAGPSSGIPMIGTRAATAHTAEIRDTDPGRKTYIGLIVLAALVAWFGYRAVGEPSEPAPPDELAFVPTTTIRPTTTTTTEVRAWTDTEVLGKYSSVFVTVELHECPADLELSTETVDSWRVSGVLVDRNNVVFDGAEIRGADVAVVRSRIGAEAIGRLTPHPSGAGVVTTATASNRNLALVDEPIGADRFSVTRDPETNGILVSEARPTSSEEPVIHVTDQGDAIGVDLGFRDLEHDDLLSIAELETEVVDSAGFGTSPCGRAPSLMDPLTAATFAEEAE